MANDREQQVRERASASRDSPGVPLTAKRMAVAPSMPPSRSADERIDLFVEQHSHLTLLAPVPRRLRCAPVALPDDIENVTKATLSNGQLVELPAALRSLGRLTTLDMSYNAIKSLPEQSWAALTSLAELNVSHNLLKALPKELAGAAQLRMLNVRSNDLRAWASACAPAVSALRELETLDLRYNPRIGALDEACDLRTIWPQAVLLRSGVGDAGGQPAVHTGAEAGVPIRRGASWSKAVPGDGPDGAWPTLHAQLAPLSTPALLGRLHSFFGKGTGRLEEDYAAVGSSREEALSQLVRAYEARQEGDGGDGGTRVSDPSRCRREVYCQGRPLPTSLCDTLLAALRATRWLAQTDRPKVAATGYLVLETEVEGGEGSEGGGAEVASGAGTVAVAGAGAWREGESASARRRRAKRSRHRALWSAVEALVAEVDADFAFSGVALSYGFRGSPHVDTYDISYQWAVSLGAFEGGQLCIESAPDEVSVVNTHGCAAKVDGRFPHWVAPWRGAERYSVIIFKTRGEPAPKGPAVYPVSSCTRTE